MADMIQNEVVYEQEVTEAEIKARNLVETPVKVTLMDKKTGEGCTLSATLWLPLAFNSLTDMVKVHGEAGVLKAALSGARNAAQNFFRTPLRKREADTLEELTKMWTLSFENPASMATADDLASMMANPLVSNESLITKMEEALGIPLTPQQKGNILTKRASLFEKK